VDVPGGRTPGGAAARRRQHLCVSVAEASVAARRIWEWTWHTVVRVGVALAAVSLLDRRSRRRRDERARARPRDTTHPGGEDPSDDELVARVCSQVRVPPGVEVVAVEGAVVLFGRIARGALEQLLARVADVDGVSVIENRLTPIDAPVQRG